MTSICVNAIYYREEREEVNKYAAETFIVFEMWAMFLGNG